MTDYFTLLRERSVSGSNLNYLNNDIGVARLFFNLHNAEICYVVESKAWYTYKSGFWKKDEGGLAVMERCKDFAEALSQHAGKIDDGSEESTAFIKYVNGFHSRKRREALLSDAKSIAPKSLASFDRDKMLFNCQNGTFSLKDMTLHPHRPEDYITKIARVKYVEGAVCERWERFIGEVMCGDTDTARFLQKVYGYCLSGEKAALEGFCLLYGNTTRNGKSTLSETIAYIFGDYARTIQPQTLARRPNDGAAASPDIARLKGARLVNMPEPEKGLELNVALIKQLSGGDTYTGRFLHENPIEFKPEFTIFINTNHLPRTADDTVFSSERVKLIPFERHFTPNEQDTGLKRLFCMPENKSGILNWLIDGYRLLMAEGLNVSARVSAAIASYREEADIIGSFLSECTAEQDGNRLATSELYTAYTGWAKDNGYRQMNNKNFVGEIRRRFDVKRDGGTGNVVINLVLDNSENPFTD